MALHFKTILEYKFKGDIRKQKIEALQKIHIGNLNMFFPKRQTELKGPVYTCAMLLAKTWQNIQFAALLVMVEIVCPVMLDKFDLQGNNKRG